MNKPDTILAAGAQGECPARLIALLQAAGYPGGGDADTLTPEIMGSVAAAQQELHVAEPDELTLTLSDGTQRVIKGKLVGQATWDALRKRAAERTGLVTATQLGAVMAEHAPAAAAASAEETAEGGKLEGEAAAAAGAEPAAADDALPEGVTAGEQKAAAEAAAAEAAKGGELP